MPKYTNLYDIRLTNIWTQYPLNLIDQLSYAILLPLRRLVLPHAKRLKISSELGQMLCNIISMRLGIGGLPEGLICEELLTILRLT